MTNTNSQASQSLLQPTKFQLQFNRIPDVVYFCQKAPIPAVKVPSVKQTTPGIDIKKAGHKLEFEPFEITFLVEEEMNSWNEIFKWMTDYATPLNSNDYKNLDRLGVPSLIKLQNGYPDAYGDATLTILSTQNTPINRFIFHDCFPTHLGKIQMDTTLSAETIITCTATFEFFYFEKVNIPG